MKVHLKIVRILIVVIIVCGLYMLGKYFFAEYTRETILKENPGIKLKLEKIDEKLRFDRVLGAEPYLMYEYGFNKKSKYILVKMTLLHKNLFNEIANKVAKVIIENYPEYKELKGIKIVDIYIYKEFGFKHKEIRNEIFLSPYGWGKRLGINH